MKQTRSKNRPELLQQAEKKLISSIDSKIKSSFITINGYRIHYVSLGKGKPVLMLHGATLGWGQWYTNLKSLAKKYHVIAIDLPGAGSSSRVRFDTKTLDEIFTDMVAQFIDRMKIKKLSIVGHSFGGWTAMRLVAKYPDKIEKVILINPVGMNRKIPPHFRLLSIPYVASILNALILGKSREKTDLFLKSVITDPITKLDQNFIDHFHHARLIQNTQSPFHLTASAIEKGKLRKEYDVLSVLRKITIPTLIIWGIKDTTMYYPQKIEKIRNKYIHIHKYHSTGHIPFIEKAHHFNNLLLTFLKE